MALRDRGQAEWRTVERLIDVREIEDLLGETWLVDCIGCTIGSVEDQLF
jgi:hypothetical protein